MTRGCEGEAFGTVIFEVIVGFVVSDDTVVGEEVLGTAGRALVVEVLVTLGCTVVAKRKNQNKKIRSCPQ